MATPMRQKLKHCLGLSYNIRTVPPNNTAMIEEVDMPKLSVEGVGEFDVPTGKRLVLALEDEARIDQLHACGGNARCTTCRVQFLAGEPD